MVSKLKLIWKYFSTVGVDEEMPQDLKRRLILSNQVCFAALLLLVAFLFFLFQNRSQAITYMGGMLLCTAYFLLMGKGKIHLARSMIIIGVPVIVVIMGYFTPPEVKLTQKTSVTNLVIVPLVIYGISEKLSMVLGLVWVMVCYMMYDWVNGLVDQTYAPYRSLDLYILDYASAGFHFLVVSFAFTYLQRINFQSEASLYNLLTETNAQKDEIASQKNELMRANQKLEILNIRTKMNPHFLYNSLNSIQRFITENDKESSLFYLTAFSRVMRSYLYYNDEGMIPLEQEMELLEEYLNLEKMRSSDKFTYRISVAQEVWETEPMIPFLLVQPFVENAVVHGVLNSKEKGTIEVTFAMKDDYLYCTVQDDGIGRVAANEIMEKKEKHQSSQGIELSVKRLRLIYDYPEHIAPIEITDLYSKTKASEGTRVTIRIPQRASFMLD
ncbi:MAG: histidine kinase [Bacteroidota bacterium]